MTTSRVEIMKALLEGVAMEMRLNLELMETSGMKINKFIATGGGIRNPKWTQLKADILNKPIETKEINEAGCFGAAMLACAAVTGEDIHSLILQDMGQTKIFYPDHYKAEIYSHKFEDYKKLYPALKQFWNPGV